MIFLALALADSNVAEHDSAGRRDAIAIGATGRNIFHQSKNFTPTPADRNRS